MKKNLRWKFIFFFIILISALWQLSYTFRYTKMSNEELANLEPGQRKILEDKSIHLGLDLKGGMHLILEVDKSKLSDEEKKGATDRALEIIRNRIDQFGVTEPSIEKQGSDRILIQLPGVADRKRAKDIIGKTALLEFRIVADKEAQQNLLSRIDEYLADIASEDSSIPEMMPLLSNIEFIQYNYYVFSDFKGEVDEYLHREDVQKSIPRDREFLWGKPEEKEGRRMFPLYLVHAEAVLTGAAILSADAGIGTSNNPMGVKVDLTMTRKARSKWAAITGANIGRKIAIILDNIVQSDPVVRERIPSGRSQITLGNSTMEEAKDLSIILRAGALPAPVRIIEERSVGPSLGADSIAKGIRSIVIGGAIIIVFMLIYYGLSGLIADFALCLNLLFILAVLSAFKFTLTLPGLAGIVLTVGAAIDANVLIFERIREELGFGKTTGAAISSGYKKAFVTILDANVTTFITAMILYFFGTGPIKGFAITLAIGILANFFTAIFVTRMIFDFGISFLKIKRISI
ncbi:MAG: protein translocase subunit SecD [Candidatus Cloacimonadota bacterium]|nr:MAG: protein translocase subunit SecD [Candidatus Cloacimonadota bacterium]